MKIIKLLFSTLFIGSSLISCDDNHDVKETQNTVKEIQASSGEDGDLLPEER